MKQYSAIIFSAILALASCSEKLEQLQAADGTAQGEAKEIFFESNYEEDTKTAISESGGSVAITWERTEPSFLHLFENGDEGSSPAISISSDKKTATFSASFSGIGLGLTFKYSAFIAANATGFVPIMPTIQTPPAGTFDPKADILIGKSESTSYVIRPSKVNMKFARVNALGRVELSGLSSGEKVSSIEICAENKIAGPLKAMNSNCEFAGYDSENATASNTVTLEFTEDNVAAADGTFNAFFGCWAVESGQIKINVYTDKAKYQKVLSANSVLFRTKTVKRIKADLTGCALPDQMYRLVKSEPLDGWSGTYMFASSDKAGNVKVFNPSKSGSKYSVDAKVIMFDGKPILGYDSSLDGCVCEITSSGKALNNQPLWNIMNYAAGGIFNITSWRYLYYDGKMRLESNNYSLGLLKINNYFSTLGNNADGSGDVRSLTTSRPLFGSELSLEDSYCLGYTEGNGFTYSAASAGPVYIYRLDDTGKEKQVLKFDNEIVNWALSSDKYVKGQTYDAQPFAEGSAYKQELLSYTSSDESVAKIDASGRITIVGEGTTVITAIAAPSEDYRAATASYTLNIYTPYYRKVTAASELKDGGKYIIVAKKTLILTSYLAFDASNPTDYDYEIHNGIFSSDVYDNGNKIKISDELNARRVILKKNVFGSLASLVGLKGDTYAINPMSLGNQYMYCDMSTMTVLDEDIPIPTYNIAFGEIKAEDLSITGIVNYFKKVATVPYNITFDEEGRVSIANASSEYLAIGANLYYNTILGKYAYINFAAIDNASELLALIANIDSSSPYAGILKLLSQVSGDDIEKLFSYFSADLYLYEYME